MTIKITLCKKCYEDFIKSDVSERFEVNKSTISECEFCKERLEKVTDSYNTTNGQEHDIGDDECESGVCPVR